MAVCIAQTVRTNYTSHRLPFLDLSNPLKGALYMVSMDSFSINRLSSTIVNQMQRDIVACYWQKTFSSVGQAHTSLKLFSSSW